MNYGLHYFKLIDRAINRKLPRGTYTERHHINPKCLGGYDKKDNLVRLTPEEHFLAHQLLVRMFPNNRKLIQAANMMTCSPHGHRNNNKQFGWLRRAVSESLTGATVPQFVRDKISATTTGRKKGPMSQEQKEQISATKLARKHPPHNKGCSGIFQHSAHTKSTMNAARKGVPRTEEVKAKIRATKAARKQAEVQIGA